MSAALERYKGNIPEHDYSALEAWSTTFYDYQHEWLFDNTKLAICCKSRQIGTSHTTAAIGVLWGAFHGELTTIISIGQRESAEVLDKCRRHVEVLRKLGSTMASTLRANSTEIVFASGGRIVALPASGGRSFSGNVFLDEYAYQEHAADVWDNAAPVTMLGHKLRVISTPNGVGNEFHALWERAGKRSSSWQRYRVPIELAVSHGYRVDIEHCWELAKGDTRIFDQMFNCSFIDSVLQYIPTEMIDECSTTMNLCESTQNPEHFAGLDIGREADLTVLTVLRRVGKHLRLVFMKSMKRTDGDALEEMVDDAFKRFNLRRLCVDATGLGTFPSERIKKKHSERIDVPHRRSRVECLNFSPTLKEGLATNLYTVMSDAALLIPKTDAALPGCEPGTARQLYKEIASLQRVITASGNVQYTTPRTSAGHADRAWSLMLAVYAVDKVHPMVQALQERMLGRSA
jgi:phage FluMu gp28-like protein